LKEITDCLEKGETVKLSSFGSFMVREKGRRVGRNPKTGIEVMISPRRVVMFKPSAVMKQQINSQPPGSGAVAGAEIVHCGPASASKLPRDINSWTAHSPPSNQRNGPAPGEAEAAIPHRDASAVIARWIKQSSIGKVGSTCSICRGLF
jgi:hypothetical protein